MSRPPLDLTPRNPEESPPEPPQGSGAAPNDLPLHEALARHAHTPPGPDELPQLVAALARLRADIESKRVALAAVAGDASAQRLLNDEIEGLCALAATLVECIERGVDHHEPGMHR